MQPSNTYTIGFAAAVCVVCSIFVSGSAVALKDRQDQNKLLDKQKKVLAVAGLMEEGQKLSPEEIQGLFDTRIKARAVDMDTDKHSDAVDAATHDMRKAAKDPALSHEVEANACKVKRVANHTIVYHVVDEAGSVEQVILPIHGPGLWSTLYGFLALETDTTTIKGITFYEHAETPGLGGEVDNPKWKSRWPGRKAFDDKGNVAIKVIKGTAGDIKKAPHEVDGLSGATITGNGVTHTAHFWLGEDGFGPYLQNFKSGGAG